MNVEDAATEARAAEAPPDRGPEQGRPRNDDQRPNRTATKADEANEGLVEKADALEFRVAASISYHVHRRDFFEALDRRARFVGLLAGTAAGAVLFKAQAEDAWQWLGAALAAINVAVLVWNPGEEPPAAFHRLPHEVVEDGWSDRDCPGERQELLLQLDVIPGRVSRSREHAHACPCPTDVDVQDRDFIATAAVSRDPGGSFVADAWELGEEAPELAVAAGKRLLLRQALQALRQVAGPLRRESVADLSG